MWQPLLLSLALLHGADGVTTARLLTHNGIELNPLLPQRVELNIPSQAGYAGLTLYGLNRLHREHPRAALLGAIAAMVVEGYAVYHNVRSIQQERR